MGDDGTQIYTTRVDGTAPRYLSQLGHVDGLTYSDTMPGGAELLQATLQADPGTRPEALNPGRRVLAIRGTSIQWEGILEEPAPGDAGWAITASGAGTWGGRYRANWTSSWDASTIVDGAISRGLRWIRGTVTGGYMSEQKDPGSISITDFMNLITSPGSKTWRVRRTFAGLQADLLTVPTAVTRLLVTTIPAVRTLAGYKNALYARYQVTKDLNGKPATYALASATLPDSIAKHDRAEDYWDVTAGGVMTGAAASGLAASALAKYLATSYAGPFVVPPGQYLTTGGVPVDHGCEKSGEVVRLILADGPYGGEVLPAPPVTFPVGKVTYRAADGTLEVTPMQSWRGDFGNLLTILAPKAPV
jgi:hypothetical protein